MLLEMKHITKEYGTLRANDDVDLSLREGEILAVVGENGAGKSTLMKILYGLEKPTEGDIYINGELQKFRSPHDAMAKKIGMVQQHFMLLQPCTVAENIVYGHEPKKSGIFFDRKRAAAITKELCEKYGLSIDPSLIVSNCPVGLQQRVEILKVLYQDASIIIFDEPSAVLTPQEVGELLKTIKKLASMGKSIIIITHKLSEVMEVADRVMVMRQGKRIKEMAKSETSIEELSFLMVGRHIVERKIPPQETTGTVLDVQDLVLSGSDKKNILDHFSIHVDAGEIVGIAGVSGNGQSELIECITGLTQITSGDILICGKTIVGKTVGERRTAGCACIPEDRYLWGCAKQATLTETSIMAHQREPAISRYGILNTKGIQKFTSGLLERYDVRSGGLSQKTGELSGGNLQKMIVAREIELNSNLLIAAEPTRGVDIGAMEFIHSRLLDKRAKGDAVLLISSELTEIMTLSDRIYVIYDGKVAGEFRKQDATEESLGILMMGGESNEPKAV
ncbi:MAG: ABC transporter ATP-binding protein [Firmicutes bacterium HGW-Firmicutes-16]|nr:MAG: ABC transporter ATP-binding protein [Firmicutes bacterium HGW-Firmicutes-16]